LEAIRDLRLNCTTLVITSDKCYENQEWEFAYRENDPMGGHDVYSMSKGCAELVTQSWVKSFFLPNPALGAVATARAGNVIGGGDYATDRIVPDAVRAVAGGQPVLVRNPDAMRPWQHVLECLGGYLALGAKLRQEGKESRFASSFNFGPDPAARQPVRHLIGELLKTLGGEWTDGSSAKGPHEAKLLSLAIDKASSMLGWKPVWSFEEGVGATAEWYHLRHVHGADNKTMAEFTSRQIRRYQNDAAQRGALWAASFSDLDCDIPTTKNQSVPV
jgi:CDP-glucose 4,6-dehydratase